MENKNKCSFIDHKNVEAKYSCQECKINMCNQCEKLHSGLFINHHLLQLDKDIKEIFSGFCEQKNHYEKLEYFCKEHNILCCSSCIVNIKGKGKGDHKDCNICFVEDIKEEKKNILKENIKLLEELSDIFQKSIIELKKINDNKEELKTQIQKIFTNIRNAINNN